MKAIVIGLEAVLRGKKVRSSSLGQLPKMVKLHETNSLLEA